MLQNDIQSTLITDKDDTKDHTYLMLNIVLVMIPVHPKFDDESPNEQATKVETPIHQVVKSKLTFPKHKRHQINNLTSKTTNSGRRTGHMKSLLYILNSNKAD